MISKKIFVGTISAILCGCMMLTGCGKKTQDEAPVASSQAGAEITTETSSNKPEGGEQQLARIHTSNRFEDSSKEQWLADGEAVRAYARKETRFNEFLVEATDLTKRPKNFLKTVDYLEANGFKMVDKKETHEGTDAEYMLIFRYEPKGITLLVSKGYTANSSWSLGFGVLIGEYGNADLRWVSANIGGYDKDPVEGEFIDGSFLIREDQSNGLPVVLYNIKHYQKGECVFAHSKIDHSIYMEEGLYDERPTGNEDKFLKEHTLVKKTDADLWFRICDRQGSTLYVEQNQHKGIDSELAGNYLCGD